MYIMSMFNYKRFYRIFISAIQGGWSDGASIFGYNAF